MANFARQMQQSCWSGRVKTIVSGSTQATRNNLVGLLLGPSSRPSLHTSASSSSGSATAMEHKHTNRLAKEQSPYLLQHAHNPVDWYPWGDEAIQAAKEQDKPIFLSVGYATCHWCHVMEHESFESEETAAIMNKNFINIKVDREERPDVDRVYMTFVQATTGGGGWPMSVWLTPDLKPFYGGTYYPGKDQYGMPSFSTVLKRIAQLWGTKRDDLQEQGNTVMEQLQEFTAPDSPTAGIGSGLDPVSLTAAVNSCAASLAKGFDRKQGGFGPAPKFPRPSEINLMLRAASQAQGAQPSTSSKKAAPPSASLLLGMSLFSLQAMAAGGMYDQLGGGFHRYSVDEFWHVPHFEKMLYDNPQLALTYLDAFRITLAKQRGSSSGSTPAAAAAADAGAALASPVGGSSGSSSGTSGGSGVSTSDEVLYDPRVYATVVRGVLDYLRRDMTHPEGGLYSAEDADSLDTETNKKSEGTFYVWTFDEIVEVLGQERASVFCEVYGVKPGGNCTLSARSDPHKEFVGKNVLAEFKRLSEAESLSSAGLPLTRAEELLGSCRQELFQRRAARPRPALDDKIVTAWNGQGISAFALAARILPAEQPPAGPCFPVEGCSPQTYMQAAVSIAEFVQRHLWDPQTKRLKRAYCKAPSSVEGFADDYALLIAGLLDLYESGGGLKWLLWAVQLQDTLDSLFWDQAGGYFQTSGTDASVLLRLKEDYDGAEPAASSVAALNLMRLAALLPEGGSGSSSDGGGVMSYGARADAALNAFSSRLQQVPMAMPQMCVAAWLKTKTPLRQVIISGPASHKSTESLLNAAHAAWAHDKAVILIDPTDADSVGFWKQHNPEAWAMVDAHYSKQGRTSGTTAAAAAPAGATEAAAAAEVSDMGLKPDAAAAGAEAGTGGDDGRFPPTAFVCQNFTCQAPTGDAAKVYELLSRQGTPVVKLQPVKL